MKLPIYWLIHIPAVLIAVLGGQEIAVYRKTAEELLDAKSSLIVQLEESQRNEETIKATKGRIEYMETSDYLDRSVYKGLIMVLVGFGLSIFAVRTKKKPNENHAMRSTEASSAE